MACFVQGQAELWKSSSLPSQACCCRLQELELLVRQGTARCDTDTSGKVLSNLSRHFYWLAINIFSASHQHDQFCSSIRWIPNCQHSTGPWLWQLQAARKHKASHLVTSLPGIHCCRYSTGPWFQQLQAARNHKVSWHLDILAWLDLQLMMSFPKVLDQFCSSSIRWIHCCQYSIGPWLQQLQASENQKVSHLATSCLVFIATEFQLALGCSSTCNLQETTRYNILPAIHCCQGSTGPWLLQHPQAARNHKVSHLATTCPG